jgi:hypothetical protein
MCLGTTFTGQFVGMFEKLRAHLDYLQDIENPSGYKRAMENVQKIVPVQRHHRVVFTMQIPDDASTQPTSEHSMILQALIF